MSRSNSIRISPGAQGLARIIERELSLEPGDNVTWVITTHKEREPLSRNSYDMDIERQYFTDTPDEAIETFRRQAHAALDLILDDVT